MVKISLQSDIKYLPGIGPKRAAILYEMGIYNVYDLLNYVPRRYIDRTNIKKINEIRLNEWVTVVGKVENFGLVKNRKMSGSRFRLIISDETGYLSLVWFKGAQYFQNAFETGEYLAVYGKVDYYNHEKQIAHPEFDRLDDEDDTDFMHTGSIIPLYPTTEALRKKWLDSRGFRRLIKPLLPVTDAIPDPLPEPLRLKKDLMNLSESYREIHFPTNTERLQRALYRFKFDEFFYLELMMAYQKKRVRLQPDGIRFEKVGDKTRQLIEQLPFQLTEGQKQALKEIREDMKSPYPMNRLLQGDVGSGKTVVALLAILMAVENGYQTAFMAPTEILADQHYIVLQEYLWGMDIPVVLLKGGQKKSEREKILSDILDHRASIVVGTHALFQESVKFAQLGLIIIDEQHRFGVMQRAEIRQKAVEAGFNPDVLVMTATPIPRTLAMTVYGDLDVSVIPELPAGRQPIRTAVRDESSRAKIYDFIRKEVSAGHQIYIVYPLIEQSEKLDLKAAVEAYEQLSGKVFPELRLGLLHGRMGSAEKQNIMKAFKDRQTDILVSTTVIEVGVNVPNATVMVIEHADRYGLTQLHQLRGRIGRGAEQSYCILMTDKKDLSEDALKRMTVMTETQDGFKIAEEDLNLRGPGEFFGTRQSGMPELKLAHLIYDRPILIAARQEAFAIIDQDPHLRHPAHVLIREKFIKDYQARFGLGQIG